ncbi:MAG: hypothetical protein ABIB79_01650, partial [archaeon]
HFMRERELGWHIILYNIKRKIKVSKDKEIQTFIFLELKIYFIWDSSTEEITLKTKINLIDYDHNNSLAYRSSNW